MKFAELRQGDVILTLEQDRRGFPFCDMARIQRAPAPTTGRAGKDGSYTQVVDLTISDSTGTYNIVVPADADEYIFERIYYTPNPNLIVQEMSVQKAKVKQILDNIDLYKSIDKECDKIISKVSQAVGSEPTPVKNDFSARMDRQEKMIEEIYTALFKQNDHENNKNNAKKETGKS